MEYLTVVIIMISFTALAYWRGNPIIYMLTAGIAIMLGLYSPDALTELGYSTFGVTIGLMLITYSFVCLAYGIGNLLK